MTKGMKSRLKQGRGLKRQELINSDWDSMRLTDFIFGNALGLTFTTEKGHVTYVKKTCMADY